MRRILPRLIGSCASSERAIRGFVFALWAYPWAANMLLKWLGEQARAGAGCGRASCGGVSSRRSSDSRRTARLRLEQANLHQPFSRHDETKSNRENRSPWAGVGPARIRASSTFREIDNLYTAPMHGFRDADDYWIRSSSRPWLNRIKVPTLADQRTQRSLFPGPRAADARRSCRGSDLGVSGLRRSCRLCVREISRTAAMASAPNPDFLGRAAITKATFASLAFKLSARV